MDRRFHQHPTRDNVLYVYRREDYEIDKGLLLDYVVDYDEESVFLKAP
jgi:hypothetical protein